MPLLEAWKSHREVGIEGVLVRCRKVPKRLLQRLRVDLAQEVVLALEIDEVVAHRGEAEPPLAALVAQLIQRQDLVPDEAGGPDEAAQERGLRCGRLEPKTITLTTRHGVHVHIFSRHCAIRTAQWGRRCAPSVLFPRPDTGLYGTRDKPTVEYS